jgi:hypothetical protein
VIPIRHLASEHSGYEMQETHVCIYGYYFGFNLISLSTYSRNYIKFRENILIRFLEVYR